MFPFGTDTYRSHLSHTSFWRDLSGEVKYDDSAVRRAISLNTIAGVAGDLYLAHTFNQGFDAVRRTLVIGAAAVVQKLDSVESSIESSAQSGHMALSSWLVNWKLRANSFRR